MSNVKWILIGFVAFVAWLQYNTNFQTTSNVLLVMSIFAAFMLGGGTVISAVKLGFSSIIGMKQAEAKVEAEKIRAQRADQQAINHETRQSDKIANERVKVMMSYYKAQLDAQYAMQVRPVVVEQEEEVYSDRYNEDDL